MNVPVYGPPPAKRRRPVTNPMSYIGTRRPIWNSDRRRWEPAGPLTLRDVLPKQS